MMKKLFALLLAAMMVLSLAACGAKEEPAPQEEQPAETPAETPAAESDVAYVQDKGTLVVGMTDFAPMDYKLEGSDEWVGFDADMARAFGAHLGVDVEFVEINWDNKALEL